MTESQVPIIHNYSSNEKKVISLGNRRKINRNRKKFDNVSKGLESSSQPIRRDRFVKLRYGKQFSEEQKLKIVNKIGKTMTKAKLAKDYNIAYSTLRKWELKLLEHERVNKDNQN